jgi:hypothetical protein
MLQYCSFKAENITKQQKCWELWQYAWRHRLQLGLDCDRKFPIQLFYNPCMLYYRWRKLKNTRGSEFWEGPGDLGKIFVSFIHDWVSKLSILQTMDKLHIFTLRVWGSKPACLCFAPILLWDQLREWVYIIIYYTYIKYINSKFSALLKSFLVNFKPVFKNINFDRLTVLFVRGKRLGTGLQGLLRISGCRPVNTLVIFISLAWTDDMRVAWTLINVFDLALLIVDRFQFRESALSKSQGAFVGKS